MGNDLISRQAAIDALKKEQAHYSHEDGVEIFYEYNHAIEALKNLPSAQPNLDEWCTDCKEYDHEKHSCPRFNHVIRRTLEERKKGEWTTEQVAEMLANIFGEECACNFNGIDEWLPSVCKYSETTCPHPKEKHGCWMQFLIQGGANMKGGSDGKKG